MCRHESCTGDYGEAHRGLDSVSIEVALLCPKCAMRIEASNHIHFGGERWEPFVKCPSCGWGAFLSLKPNAVFPGGKEAVPEAAKPEEPPVEEPVSWEERRIWWQEEADRQVSSLGGWEVLEYWKGVCLRGISAEQKRAIAAGIEHALEQARAATKEVK